jgi:hypothetical protein
MRSRFLALPSACPPLLLFAAACGEPSPTTVFRDPGFPDAATRDGGAPLPDAGAFDAALFDAGAYDAAPPCVGLRCQVASCASGKTSLSGTVYAPNGTLPLYNVIVFVPNAPLEPFSAGVSCDQCGVGVSGAPIVSTLTDAHGAFRLEGVPVGKDIPLVFQVGKWRRRVTLPEVRPCVDNALTDPQLTRLPKNRSEGDLPRIAVTTGDCDKIACLLPKIGIAPEEFGGPSDGKAVTFYQGAVGYGVDPSLPGQQPYWSELPTPRALWDSPGELHKYDLAMLACECSESASLLANDTSLSKDPRSFAAVASYLDQGGRIFTTDFQYTWYKYSPDPAMRATATFPGGAPPGNTPVKLDTSFPKGKALADWLDEVNPQGGYGEVPINTVFANVGSTNPQSVQVWGSSAGYDFGAGTPASSEARFLTINTPVGKPADAQCGKAVHLDAHISETDVVDGTFPAGCTTELSAGEKTFAFFLFDLSSCIQAEDAPPVAPPVLH